MTNKLSCLSTTTLIQLAHGEVLPDELHDIEEHVTDCQSCRHSMQMAEDDPHWTNNILPVLKAPKEEVPPSDDPKVCADNESILRLLGPTDDPNMLGRIGSYEIAGIVGRGGMGIVFKAFDASLDRFVAIKILLPHLAASGAARKRFSREARAAAAVIDDHVLPIYGVDEWQRTPYLVTQYLRGMTLQKRIHEQGPLELKEILRIGLQTARGLAAAHAQGLVHRDVKPSNILLDGTVERALLTDFGLARAADDASVTRTGTVTGTPQYMSPEQVRGELVDARSDLFSLGSTLYAMCTGRSPFRADSTYGVMHRITEGAPSPIQQVNPEIPEWLCDVITKLMANRPNDRFESAQEIAELLEECLAHVQQPTAVPLPKRCLELRTDFVTSNGQKPTTAERSPVRRGLLLLTLGFVMCLAGVLIVLETGKGKLTIESEADGVPIRITQDGEIVKSLTVSKTGAGVRVAAGQYRVEIDGDVDGLAVNNGNAMTLERRGEEIVRIVYATKSPEGEPENAASGADNVERTPENLLGPSRLATTGGSDPAVQRSSRVRRVIHGAKAPDGREGRNLSWGKPVNGLQVAHELAPHRRNYYYGAAPQVRSYVRNNSQKPVFFFTHNARPSNVVRVEVKSLDGTVQTIERGPHVSVRLSLLRYQLEPGYEAIIDCGDFAFCRSQADGTAVESSFNLKSAPGTYLLNFDVRLLGVNDESYLDKDDDRHDISLTTKPTVIAVDGPREHRLGRKSTDTDDNRIAWGESKYGLQAGVRIEPDRERYRPGEQVNVRCFVRNVSDATIDFSTTTYGAHAVPVQIMDRAGRYLEVTSPPRDREPGIERFKLQPGLTVDVGEYALGIASNREDHAPFGHPDVSVVYTESGTYHVLVGVRLVDVVHNRSAKVSRPLGLWTGKTSLEVVSNQNRTDLEELENELIDSKIKSNGFSGVYVVHVSPSKGETKLDLDRGQKFGPIAAPSTADLSFPMSGDAPSSTVFALNSIVCTLPDEDPWSLSLENVRDRLALEKSVPARQLAGPQDELPKFFAFQTDAGAVGILSVDQIDPDTGQTTIRYRIRIVNKDTVDFTQPSGQRTMKISPAKREVMLDLESGNTFGPIDIVGRSEQPPSADLSFAKGGLVSLNMLVLPLEDDIPDEAIHSLPLKGQPPSAKLMVEPDANLPKHFAFLTNEGTRGILRVDEMDPATGETLLRYRFVKQSDDVEEKSEVERTPESTRDDTRAGQIPTAIVLLTILREYDQTMEAGFTVEGTKIDIPGESAGGNLPPTRRAWKLSMSPGKFGYESRILEVLSWREIVGPSGIVPPRNEHPDFAFELRQRIFLNHDVLADYCYFAAEPIFRPGRVEPPTDDNPGLATRASLTTHPASEANRYGVKNDPLWAMGRGYSPFIERITSIKLLDNEWLSVAATGKDKWPARWELLIDPEAGYLVRQSKIFWGEADSPGFVLTTFGIQQIGTVSIPKSYKLLEDTGYGEVVNSKIGGSFTNAKASADVEFLRSMESILAPPYPVPTQVVND